MTFQFEKLTTSAQAAVANAQTFAGGKGHAEITPIHLLLALLKEADGVVPAVVDKIGESREQLTSTVESEVERLPSSTSSSSPSVSRSLQQVFEAAAKSAGSMSDEFVSTEHLLIALTEIESPAKHLVHKKTSLSDSPREVLNHIELSDKTTL
ncbi:hypothetical protein N9Y42_11215 [Mariniblastus sp.]|nr:hypothetical protein [Mariniblastus sp.]